MASTWARSVAHSLDEALGLLATAIRDCPDVLWESPMWPVPALPADHQFLDSDWNPIIASDRRVTLAQRWLERRSTPWSVAWHALECFDYDLNGDFEPWAPPPPFTGHPHWRDLPSLDAPWPRTELLSYVEYCRGRARDILAALTDEQAARPLPKSHRYGGEPHAQIIVGMVGHTTEHAAQIRQFMAQRDP